MSNTKVCSKCEKQWPATTKYFHLNGRRLYSSCRACRTTTPKQRNFALAKMYCPDDKKVCTTCLRCWPETAGYFYPSGDCPGKFRGKCLACAAHPSRRDLVLQQLLAPDGLRVCSVCLTAKPATTEHFRLFTVEQQLSRKCKKCACQQARTYYNEHREERREYDNSEERVEAKKRHRMENRERYRQLAVVNAGRRRALELQAEGGYTQYDISQMYEQQQGMCCYCEVSLENTYHIEHIIPLSRGGSNWPDNIALSCASCNSRKGARTLMEFLPVLGYATNAGGVMF